MRAPDCCGRPMMHFTVTDADGGRSHREWYCAECERRLPLHWWPWMWLWLRVSRDDLADGFVIPHWWLGAVGALRGWEQQSVVFTVVPLNLAIDGLAWLRDRLRFRRKNRWERALEAAYRSGRVDGQRAERARVVNRIAEWERRQVADGVSVGDERLEETRHVLDVATARTS